MNTLLDFRRRTSRRLNNKLNTFIGMIDLRNMTTLRILIFTCLVGLIRFSVAGQKQEIFLMGTTLGTGHQPLSGVNIRIKNSLQGTYSNQEGAFKLKIDPLKDSILIFSMLNYETLALRLLLYPENKIIVVLKPVSIDLSEVEVTEKRLTNTGTVNIDPILSKNLANAGGGSIEQLIKTLPGVSSHNELTSQYSVRGGNYDENLLYVNGVEIFRPFLVKRGEQEGMSFLNPDLVSAIRFSSGGFESSYGDKMSSVLDIDYKVPGKSKGSTEIGTLGASAHLEGRALKNKFSYLTGLRYRNNRYLLGTLDQKGHYDPAFFDFQALLGFDFSPKFSLNLLANYSTNTYAFSPESRETNFGTMSQSYRLKIYFDGHEKDLFTNRFGALTAYYHPNKKLDLQLTASSFDADETQRSDIRGQYYLNEIIAGSSPSVSPDSSLLLGVGSALVHAADYLQSSILNVEQRGRYSSNSHRLQWGIKFQSEHIHDLVNEWEMRDSAGYSLPYNNQTVNLYSTVKANNQINSLRYSAFFQDTYTARLSDNLLIFNIGSRLQHWNFNRQTIVSPRISLMWLPGRSKQFQWHAAWGIYQQMPFYKELKNRSAQLVSDVQAQKSIQTLIGMDYSFRWNDRPYKFSTEIWYKSLSNLIPYKITNLDVQYFPEQQAKGYATGLELKIFGEPIPGATSWASVTLMKTAEDILGDHYEQQGVDGNPSKIIYPGYLPRPTDQRFNLSLFLQDYLPGNPTVKMNLTLLYGSGLPFGPPKGERWMDSFRMPAYKRVDIGFSKMLQGSPNPKKMNFLTKNLSAAWVSFEIFNLFDLNNTISYYWVSDFQNQMHAVPNYLTGRRINLKVSVSF